MTLIQDILAKKNLDPELFDHGEKLTLDMPIDVHVKWVYNNIYAKPYPNAVDTNGISRNIHGVQHVTRAAINIPIFANLFRRFKDKEALYLNDEDIKLLQIAALFHDSAREGEGEDLWDQESALFFYQYATKILNVTPSKAKLLAEAIANKDAYEANYFELKEMAWVRRETKLSRNIYQKLIHDADCLEIIRARGHFDAKYLDFYKYIAQDNKVAFDIIAILITEARSLIAFQGDSHLSTNYELKHKYEHEHAYFSIMACISEHPFLHPLIIRLSKETLLTEYELWQPLLKSYAKEPLSVVTEQLLTEAMSSGKLFLRGIGAPGAFHTNRTKIDETAGVVEIRKMTRVPGRRTRTKKPDNIKKYGNPNRSVSMISHGTGVFANQGFLILNPNIDHVSEISCTNASTGFGKKNHIIPVKLRSVKERELYLLHQILKMGGASQRVGDEITTHNEILYRITKADAIYFTQDPTPYNRRMHGNYLPQNPHTHYLQALYLQIEYQKATGIILPIFEYSGVHNFIKAAPKYSEDEIVAMWVSMVSKLVTDDLKTRGYCSDSLTMLKIKAIDGCISNYELKKKRIPIDINYPPLLRAKIDLALEEEKSKCLDRYINELKDGEPSALSNKSFNMYMDFPNLIPDIVDQINLQCLHFLNVEFQNPIEYFIKIKSSQAKDSFRSIFYPLYNDKLSKIYFLGKLFNKKLCDQIESKMDEVILDLFKKIPEYEGTFYIQKEEQFRDLINYLVKFNKFDQYEDLLSSLLTKITKPGDVYSCLIIIRVLGNSGLLRGKVKEQVEKIKDIISNDYYYYSPTVEKIKQEIKEYIAPEKIDDKASELMHNYVPKYLRPVLNSVNLAYKIREKTTLSLTKTEISLLEVLNIIKEKSLNLRKNLHNDAAKVAEELNLKIYDIFIDYKLNKIDKDCFKEHCKIEIKKAHDVLDKHRGFKEIIGNLVFAIATLGLINIISRRFTIFHLKTKSCKILDELDQSIASLSIDFRSNI